MNEESVSTREYSTGRERRVARGAARRVDAPLARSKAIGAVERVASSAGAVCARGRASDVTKKRTRFWQRVIHSGARDWVPRRHPRGISRGSLGTWETASQRTVENAEPFFPTLAGGEMPDETRD